MSTTLAKNYRGAGKRNLSGHALSRFFPRKVMHWVVLGFALVVIPLLLAVVSATHFVRQLANDSQITVLEGTQAVRHSRSLGDYLMGMERNARVYQVIGDTSLLDTYHELHLEFEKTASKLLMSESEQHTLAKIAELLSLESEFYAVLRKEPPNSTLAVNSLNKFDDMREIVRGLIDKNSDDIRQRVQELHSYASDAQSILLWEAFMIIPVAMGLGFLIMLRVTGPIKELDKSIHQLGSGDISQRIKVTGPDDIQALAQRLEWLRERLTELADQKRVFLQHISHELKTPMASIREGTGLLKDRIVGPLNEQQEEIADILEKSGLHLQKRIEDLLAFSITDEPKAELELQWVPLSGIIHDVVDDHQLSIRSKDLELVMNLTDMKIHADVEKLTAIVDNLISNAVKFSSESSQLHISESLQNDRLQLDVIDSGPGIHPSECEQVFQPFYQGSTRSSGHLKGTGLGLAIARLYARMHHGEIKALERSGGAHLRLILPVGTPPDQEDEATCIDTSLN
ncbi:MAG TPA: hypothetical protein DIW43_16380 [Spongiibacteraceae bacterium]|nr:hypothetical protein [Spongiibacteraceae bacterium]HCS29035.1 hypothetical protein [Spongiibacteraceae bacterium]